MLQLNSVSWLSSTTQNPMLWLPQSNSQSSQDSCAFNSISNSKTSNTKKKKKLSLKCQYYDQQQKSFTSSSRPSSSSATPVGESPPKVFVGHSIYKGKAALTIEPRAPEFSPLESGAYKLVKEGFVLSQFAPASSARQYDWTRKQVFSLSVTEIGHLVSLGARDSCEFFHDPNKGRSDEGKVRKVLKVEPLPDGSGHFFNLSVQNKVLNIDESIYIPVTRAEYTVLISAFNYILPYLLGWHAYANANSIKSADSSRENNVNPRYGGDYDWNSIEGQLHRKCLRQAGSVSFRRKFVYQRSFLVESTGGIVPAAWMQRWRHSLKYMKEGSCIINTASANAYTGGSQFLDYSSTKGAIVTFTRGLSQLLISKGIRVNAVSPGPVWTPIQPASLPAEKVASLGSDVPMDRAAQPYEIAPSYVFLASDECSSYFTGQVLHPNGMRANCQCLIWSWVSVQLICSSRSATLCFCTIVISGPEGCGIHGMVDNVVIYFQNSNNESSIMKEMLAL
ncbi:hypothetical protein D5086_019727 [Populus alba]|uniref:Uncharacterized protein n=1 Tax=Populus alba TaxID=43335 RepID=A0ACC4BJM4_POPAL